MKLKFSRTQFTALYDLLQQMVIAARPKGIETKLLHAILVDVYKTFYKKAFDLNKRQYSITMADHEACAFWLFFQKFTIPEEMTFERNLVNTISNQIHQKYSS